MNLSDTTIPRAGGTASPSAVAALSFGVVPAAASDCTPFSSLPPQVHSKSGETASHAKIPRGKFAACLTPLDDAGPLISSDAAFPVSVGTFFSKNELLSAAQEDLPALLIVCFSPELLRSPLSYDARRPQQVLLQQQVPPKRRLQQPDSQLQQQTTTLGEQPSRVPGRSDVLAEEQQVEKKGKLPAPHAELAACTDAPIYLPADSPAWLFLAESFLPSLGLSFPLGNGESSASWVEKRLGTHGERLVKQQQREDSAQRREEEEEEQQQPRLEGELQTGALRNSKEGVSQPRLQQLPQVCLLQTKYYEAPLRLQYLFYESTTTSEKKFGSPDVVNHAATGSNDRCVDIPASIGGAPLHLTAPPEAVLFLCRSFADLYRAPRLLATAVSSCTGNDSITSSVSVDEEPTAAAAIAAAAKGDILPLPRALHRPPYIVLGRNQQQQEQNGAVRTAAALQNNDPRAQGGAKKDRAEKSCLTSQQRSCALEAITEKGGGATTTAGSWLSSVPVKLLVCFDAEEKEETDEDREKGSAALNGGGLSSKSCTAAYEEECDDPSVILFFNNSCFLEKVSLPLPSCSPKTDVAAPDGLSAVFPLATGGEGGETGTYGTAAGPAALNEGKADMSATQEMKKAGLLCSVRPLLGGSAALPLLPGKGLEGKGCIHAHQRVVEALHCHMWPSMRRLRNSRKDATASTGSTPTRATPCGSESTELYCSNMAKVSSSKAHSLSRRVDDSARRRRTNARTVGAAGCDNKGEEAAEVYEPEISSPAVTRTTTGGGVATAEEEITSQTAGRSVGGGKTSGIRGAGGGSGQRSSSAERRTVLSVTGDGVYKTNERTAPRSGCVAAATGRTREGEKRSRASERQKKYAEEMNLQAWESLARTVREMRLEAHQLPRAERTAKAETLALQLASALGLSSDEEEDKKQT